jgi:hypothetical protein
MKIFSGPENQADAGGQHARGWLTTNAVMPGLGSLAAGRKVGLLQLALSLGSFAVTTGCGVHFIYWSLAHWSEFHSVNAEEDPLQPLRDLWHQARWPMLGIALFLISWLWALLTSRSLLRAANGKPPLLSTVPNEK